MSDYKQPDEQIAALRTQVEEAIRIAGEAIGTDPSLRSVACVQVLADRAERLSRQVEELMAKLAAVCPVCTRLTCEGTHEKTSAETIMVLRRQVEELTRDHERLSREVKRLSASALCLVDEYRSHGGKDTHQECMPGCGCALPDKVTLLEAEARAIRAAHANGTACLLREEPKPE